MGLFDYVKTILPGRKREVALYDNQAPLFTSFGKNIYLSDFVNNAIDRVATEISKIDIRSVTQAKEEIVPQNDDITRLFRFKPNPLQTTSDFLANVEWLRRKHGNAFVYPQYELVQTPRGSFKRYMAFYPLNPSAISIGEKKGEAWEIQFDFPDGSRYTLPYVELIHLKWRRGTNTVIGGGDDAGKSNDYSVIRTIDALDKTIQGLPKSIEASAQIKGVYTAKSMADAKKLNETRDEFEQHVSTSKSGVVAVDLTGDFTPVNIRVAEIPESVMKFLKSVIEEKYGVSAAILSGDYNGEQHGAFYQTAIEDFINQFEQATSHTLFTEREKDVGHRIKCYYSKVNYMSMQDKKDLAELAKDVGNMTLNQINDMFGLEPFEGGNRRVQSLNYVNVEHIDAYQQQKAGVKNET